MGFRVRRDDSNPAARIGVAFAHASLLAAALLSGCTSATRPRWPGPADPGGGPTQAERPRDRAADLGVELTAAETPPASTAALLAPVIPPPDQEYPIDLTTALRLAEVENPLIAEARQRIGEAMGVQQGAMALLLPTLNVGMNFHAHTGNLQRSSGRVLNLNEQSLYFGGGSAVFASSTPQVPAVSIYSALTDAVFEPLAARQLVEGARFGASATANTILLEVAQLHFDLLAAEARLRVRRESARQEAEVARLTRAYAEAQQGREADAERAETELTLIVDEVQQAEEDVSVASARLARRLHLDQSVRLQPLAPMVEKVTIVDPGVPLPDLIQAALQRRPELGSRAAAVAAAEVRYKQEVYRPLLPTLWLGYSAGAFGGGSNLVGPELANFAGRNDFDVMAFWTFENLGLGNLSRQKRRKAEVGVAVGERSRVIALVRSEVGAAYADVSAARQQVDITTRQLASAEAGFAEDLDRIRNTVGRPIEVVNSLQLLNQARVDRIRALNDYNKAEFRLFVSLGSPPPLGESPDAPIPPAPVAAPLLPPLARGADRRTQ
jgi:outer membrane protein TolC